MIVELAEILDTTAGYLLNGEKGSNFDGEEQELIEIFSLLKSPTLKKVAIEQLRVLVLAN